MPKNVICGVGPYLSKTDTINLGNVNRHLYIETQNVGFLTNQRKFDNWQISKWNSLSLFTDREKFESHDGMVNITRNSIKALLDQKQTGNAHSFPSQLEFSSIDGTYLFKSK